MYLDLEKYDPKTQTWKRIERIHATSVPVKTNKQFLFFKWTTTDYEMVETREEFHNRACAIANKHYQAQGGPMKLWVEYGDVASFTLWMNGKRLT